jgi:FAD/FMN-containing dehydrogenase
VENAIKFVTKHNIRLSIINTGHDYAGKNDAPSGLNLDVSQLRGVRLSPSFTPTAEGVRSVEPGKPVEIIQQIPGQQPAVTFGVGVIGSELNRAIKANKLFVVTGGAGSNNQHNLRLQILTPSSHSCRCWWMGSNCWFGF